MCLKSLPFILVLFAVILPVGANVPSTGAADDISGTWNLRVETADGTANPVVVLRQEGSKLSGTYRGRMGEVPLQGSVDGASVRFVVKLRFRDESTTVTYTGTVRGNEMSGSVRFGDAGEGKWSARRAEGGA